MEQYKHGGFLADHQTIELDFSINVHPFGAPDSVKEAIKGCLEEIEKYPDPTVRELREALAIKHNVSYQQILCGNGASDLLFRLTAFLKPKKALVLAPTFSEYERVVPLFGGVVIEHPLVAEKRFTLDTSLLEKLTDDVELLFLCNPNNPTGGLIPESVLDTILSHSQKRGLMVVVDECFIEFTQAKSLITKLDHYPKLLILRAFTKFYGLAGVRLGYLLGDCELLKKIQAFGPEWNVSLIAQVAGLQALRELDWPEQTRLLITAERDYVTEKLCLLGLNVFESAANFLLIHSPIPLYEPLLKKRIHVRDCRTFSGLDEHYTRIGLKTRPENDQLIHAIKKILQKKDLPREV